MDRVSEAGRPVKRVKSDWREVVLVCRKCSKKLDGGFGPEGDQRLAKAIRKTVAEPSRREAGAARRARVAVIEVGCLDMCPKNAVVALRAGAPQDWLIVPRGADVGRVTIALGLVEPSGDRQAVPVT